MEAVNIVLKAQYAAMERLEPGVTLGEIDRAARSVIETAGYGEFFVHSVGHGVGLEVHEQPGVAGGNDSIALPGMVFTLEPAVYVAGEMGVRIEDMVVVTESGYVKLSSLPRHPGELQEFLSER
jgi:Xaa-Pro aminopeptidase